MGETILIKQSQPQFFYWHLKFDRHRLIETHFKSAIGIWTRNEPFRFRFTLLLTFSRNNYKENCFELEPLVSLVIFLTLSRTYKFIVRIACRCPFVDFECW